MDFTSLASALGNSEIGTSSLGGAGTAGGNTISGGAGIAVVDDVLFKIVSFSGVEPRDCDADLSGLENKHH